MKKVLLIVIILLLGLLTYYSLARGIEIGGFKILSIDQIKQQNDDLDGKILETVELIDTKYPETLSSLKTASNKLESAKKEYLNLSSLSSEEDIIKATMEESYDIGLLWTKIGNYARSKGTNVEMAVTANSTAGVSGLYNLDFTVNGTYVSIISFIEAIENDSLLNFRIKSFKLLPYEGSILKATFTINNVAIEGNTSKQNIGQSSGTVVTEVSNPNGSSTNNTNAQNSTTTNRGTTTNANTNTVSNADTNNSANTNQNTSTNSAATIN